MNKGDVETIDGISFEYVDEKRCKCKSCEKIIYQLLKKAHAHSHVASSLPSKAIENSEKNSKIEEKMGVQGNMANSHEKIDERQGLQLLFEVTRNGNSEKVTKNLEKTVILVENSGNEQKVNCTNSQEMKNSTIEKTVIEGKAIQKPIGENDMANKLPYEKSQTESKKIFGAVKKSCLTFNEVNNTLNFEDIQMKAKEIAGQEEKCIEKIKDNNEIKKNNVNSEKSIKLTTLDVKTAKKTQSIPSQKVSGIIIEGDNLPEISKENLPQKRMQKLDSEKSPAKRKKFARLLFWIKKTKKCMYLLGKLNQVYERWVFLKYLHYFRILKKRVKNN